MSGYVESLLGANERVEVRERQHWFVWVPQFFVSLIISAVIAAACILLSARFSFAIFGLVFILIPVLVFLRVFLKWRNEEYIVTNRRIIQTEGVINKNIMDSSLEKINDVELTQTVIGRMMDFGDLNILTGSDYGVNKLHHIQSPVKFKIAMLNAKEGMRDPNDFVAAAPGKHPAEHRDIPELIQELTELHTKGMITDAEFQEKRAKLMSQI
ncbi:MAG TPA: PH domain-containing protein [Anaerolineae bacterium]|jgi:uncharacterized membrane protein YdbT with pleckstrin-like domain